MQQVAPTGTQQNAEQQASPRSNGDEDRRTHHFQRPCRADRDLRHDLSVVSSRRMRVTQAQFAADLAHQISRTFFRAYWSHANGMSEDELLIEHDIEAAAANIDKHVAETCRRTISTAVKAVDRNVPYLIALVYLMQRLDTRIKQLLKAKRTRAARTRTKEPNRAVDKNKQTQQQRSAALP